MSDNVAVEDAVSTKEQKQQPLFSGRVQVYPKKVSGFFRRMKWQVLAVLLGIYYLVPWIRWDRGPGAPDQAVLIDMPSRRAYFFFIEIWPQEVYYLAGLLILGAVGLFFVTSLFGRVWCGYTCPQTVWTDLYMWIERQIEGDRNARIKLDKQPLSAAKAVKKVSKHAAWLIIALLTGGAWIMYFNDAPTLVGELFTGQASTLVYGFLGLFTATTYILAGWAREQVCTYMCPWPRFQAAMFDEDTLIVTYQRWRGEPRGHAKKGEDWSQRGDCIDCNACVAACPTGIDIRDGNQLECIGCGLCIDACNEIMPKVGRPTELITMDTERNQYALEHGEERPKRHLVRPRTLLYALLFFGIGLVMLGSLFFRATLDINVLHDRNPLFVTLSNGDIRNGYTIKLLNKTREGRSFTLSFEGIEGAEMWVIGKEETPAAQLQLSAEPDSVATYQAYVRVPAEAVDAAKLDIRFLLSDTETGETVVKDTVFRGPER